MSPSSPVIPFPVFKYVRIGALVVLALVATITFYSSSSASLEQSRLNNRRVAGPTADSLRNIAMPRRLGAFSPWFMPPAPPPEALATYDATCTTPKTTFDLGETVCLKTTDVPVNSPALRSVTWSNPASQEIQRTDLVSSPNDTFVVPASQTSVVDGLVVDNRGTWTVKVVLAGRSNVRAATTFTVKDPDNAAFDLNVYTAADTAEGDVPAGTNLTVLTAVNNFGPNDAANVELEQAVPSNATFVSAAQTSGPTFTCLNPSSGGVGTSNCTIASLPAGGTAEFTFVYLIGAAAPKGTLINSLATVTPNTTVAGELHTPDNAWTARATVTDNPNAPTCAIGCPANITVSGTAPTVVNFADDLEVSGSCGTVTATPASGSLFPVGTTTVNVTSTQGASCSFTVTVSATAAPTITCAADQTEAATGTDLEIPVMVNAPTADGTNVTITGVRSDNRGVSDPYPVGTTTITWTATECTDLPDCSDPNARFASCIQHITVTNPNAPTIMCPADKTFDAGGDCQKTLTLAQIGTPVTGGPGVTTTSDRSDNLELTDPFPAGQTVIIWTATNALGSVSCSQTITITASGDTTPPTLTVPPDVSVTTTTCSALVDDELGVATATDTCSAVNIKRTGVPLTPVANGPIACPTIANPAQRCVENFNFPVGTTDVTYTATDAAGNQTVGVQHVTVHETTPPTFTFVPADLSFNTGPGATSCGVFVGDATLGSATVADNCETTVIRSGVPAGNNFPVGQTVITYTAKADTSVTATQIINVVDNTVPVVTAPAPVTLFTGPGATACGVTVSNLDATFGTGSATDNCPGVGAVTRSGVPAGNAFPVGQTTLTYSVTDAHGNTSSATQLVTVVDNTPPVISCQADIIADFNAAVNGAVVTYTTPVGTDNCASTTTQIAGLASGSTFPVGTTTNTFRVTDASGNTAQCSFNVTVALTSLIGLDSVTITGAGYADSYSSAGGYPATKGSLANILSNGTITIGNSGKVWGNVRSTRAGVNMTGASQVTGNATAGTTVTTSGSATVGGTRTNNALAPVMTLPSVVPCASFSSASGISGTYSYNAGTGDLTLSGINIATLANGTYCFHNVTLGNSAQLKVNGPVVIKLTGSLNTSGASNLNNTTQIPSNLRILSSFSGSNGVVIGNSVSVYALFYAPTTNVNMSGAAPLFGTAVGKAITIGNSGAIHYDTQLKAIWPALWPLILAP